MANVVSKGYALAMLLLTTYFFANFVLLLPDWGVPLGTTGVQGIFGPGYSWLNWIVVVSWYWYWFLTGD